MWQNKELRKEFVEKLLLGDDAKKWWLKTRVTPLKSVSTGLAQDIGDNGEVTEVPDITYAKVEVSPLIGASAELKGENQDDGGRELNLTGTLGPGVFQGEKSTKSDSGGDGGEEGGNYFTESYEGYKALLWGPEL